MQTKKPAHRLHPAVALLASLSLQAIAWSCFGDNHPSANTNDVIYLNYTPERRAEDLVKIEKYVNAWTNQPRGFACNNPNRIRDLIAAQPDAVSAGRLTGLWENLQASRPHRSVRLEDYACEFIKNAGLSADDPDSRQLAAHFFTMMMCIPDLSFPPPSSLDSPNWRYGAEGVYGRLTRLMDIAPSSLLETAETYQSLAGFIGEVRMNIVPDFGPLGKGNYYTYTGEKDALFYLRNWCYALQTHQHDLQNVCRSWNGFMIKYRIRDFANEMPPDERKQFLDKIKELARSDAEEAKLLDTPIAPVKITFAPVEMEREFLSKLPPEQRKQEIDRAKRESDYTAEQLKQLEAPFE